ncbi:putative RNA-directed DNA polymerase [Helianthus annuus]|nr:putative RNA-directed DNA polymerase [Helianthus annuus]KAJ0596486.1 putative RNA-directed DNA polymerase [Helianthus annuus]KAJ0757146.1 putative RNA-directed DNA polymerase [Helianthus annuus]
MAWMRCDAMIKGWLTTAMEKEIRSSVKYASTSAEIWKDLSERFGKESAPRAYELKQQLGNTRQEGASVSAYYTKMRGIWDEIQSVLPMPKCSCSGCSCDVGKKTMERLEKERLYEFLMGLDAEFSVIKTQILAMKPTPTLGTAYHLVAEDEQQRSISDGKKGTIEAAAFQAVQKGNRSGNSSQGKTWQRSEKGTTGEKTDHCTVCGRDGHNKDGCFKVIGYPDWWPGKKSKERVKPKVALVETGGSSPIPGLTDDQYQLLLKQFGATGITPDDQKPPVANMAGKIYDKNNWVVDSGATEHITHQVSMFDDMKHGINELPVTIPNGQSIAVKGKGAITLPGGTKDLESRSLIGTGTCDDGLYRMGELKNGRRAMLVDASLWHKRLGHASSQKLCHLDFFKHVSVNSVNKDFCDSCMKAKHTRLPFPISSIKTTAPFDMIHCDIWGGYKTPSSNQSRYFLTIVDDYSRAVWVYLLRHKSDASDHVVYFQRMVKTQFGKVIKKIRCDNGGEFVSNRMVKFYKEEGMLLETTCPHTPQQNGVVERKHRHLLETARALRFEAKLPAKLWGECILTAAYIINRLPSEVIGNKTPYELVLNQEPEYGHMRVFGCLAYYWNTDAKNDKFDVRGKPGVFLGYPHGTKGYTIYDLGERKMVKSRDVRFVEHVFPFSKIPQCGKEDVLFEYPFDKSTDTKEKELEGHVGQKEGLEEDVHDVLSHQTNEDDVDNTQHFETDVDNSNFLEEGVDITSPMSPHEFTDQEQVLNNHTVGLDDAPNLDDNQATEIRAQRHRVLPKRFDDYNVKLPPSVDPTQSSSNMAASTPRSFVQASQNEQWRNAMSKEIKALEENNTWTLETLPKGKRAIESKWVYKIKYKPSGEVERYKARLVAKGYTQQEGIDFHDTFAPVAKLVTVRTLLAVAVKKIKALEENNTWTLETLPKGKRAIESKWVYKIKYKPSGEVERYKARLVAKGYTQQEGIDFHDTFAPVAKLVTVRTLLAVAVKKDWIIGQLDVNNAFLHGDLDEEVYMKIPQGFSREGETRVCRLRKSIYGLKQASRNWYQKFTKVLIGLGFRQSVADHSLFIFKKEGVFVAALIYVDDVIIVGNNQRQINITKSVLDKEFSIKDLGPLKYFLGIEVTRTGEGLVLTQRKYVLDILAECGLLGCRPSLFPMEQNLKLDMCEDAERVDANQYRRLVGKLLYLQATRPDITHSVNVLSQFVTDPREPHQEAALRVLRYLKTTPGQGILLPKAGDLELSTYCDSDWLGCPYTRRSRTGYLLLLGGAPISWKSKKQSVVSRSSAEAEYRAMATTVSEVLWVRFLLKELDEPPSKPTTLYCDNQAARHIANNPVFHERTKHVEMDCYFVRERVESGEILPMHIATRSQIADLFTKALGSQHLNSLLLKLGIRNLHAPACGGVKDNN